MKIVLIGIPGAGKSTQGNLLSHQLKIPYLSTGHIFREIAKEKTHLGHYVKHVMHSGLLIPDSKTIEIVNEYLSRSEYQRGYILDGFPRTVHQAEKFSNNVDKVFYLETPDKDALWRLAYRNHTGRNDDTIEAIKKRIEVFHKFTDPVINYYQLAGKLTILDATTSIDEVNEEILKSLGKQLIKNQIHAWHQRHKAIIAIVGLPGSGKTEAANYLKEKKIPSIYFGQAVLDLVNEKHRTYSEEFEKQARMDIRKKHGKAALAILNEKAIANALESNNIVIVESMRSWEEYTHLKKTFSDVNIYILALHTDKKIRYHRLLHRKTRSISEGEERDISELIDTNMGATIAFADFLVKNNFSLVEFHDKLEQVYRTIYFS